MPQGKLEYQLALKNSPIGPIAARKANASVTPPNWASTPEAATERRRIRPSGLPVATAYASTAPKTAPPSDDARANWNDPMKALPTPGAVKSRLENVKPPVELRNA